MEREHFARISWSAEQLARGLPNLAEMIDPVWFAGDPPCLDGWSLVCRFPRTPAVQGSPSEARVRFLMDGAPHARLEPGRELRMYERATGQHASVEILD